MTRPRVYFDIKIGPTPAGRVEFELFNDIVPLTSENFRCLCTGEHGSTMSFLNSSFHRIIPGFMAQGGDYTKHDGTGGRSIYGDKFDDENFKVKHNQGGLLSMANRDNKHVVFGKVVTGMNIVKMLEKIQTSKDDRPRQPVKITGCGESTSSKSDTLHSISRHDDGSEETVEKGKAAEAEEEELPKEWNKRINPQDFSAVPPPVFEEENKLRKDEVAELPDLVAPLNMTPAQKKLFELKQRLNKERNANRKEVKNEHERLSNKSETAEKRSNAIHAEKRKREKAELDGVDHLNMTAEQAQGIANKREKKEMNKASYGWNVFNQESLYRAHDKRVAKLPTTTVGDRDGDSEAASSAVVGMDVLNSTNISRTVDSSEGIDRMVTDLEEQEANRTKFSRRRANLEGFDVDYINDRNKHFNKKIDRAFDKYTVEIRQNLERGTAL